jgi:tetratricopeptide (TPR) repeat protein
VLTPPSGPAALDGWQAGTGKTQLAAFAAESLWRSQAVDILVWVAASSADSILTSFARASSAVAGPDPARDTQQAAVRYLDWLAGNRRPWLVVLDDLADRADLAELWPEGPAGRVLVTTNNPACLADARGVRQLPVGGFTGREAMSYLMARLARHPDQRIGAADLVEDLAGLPLALAQASAMIRASGQTCREYSEQFARRRAQMQATARSEPPATAVTWTLSLELADRMAPAGLAQQVLAQAALLDCHAIPGPVFTRAAVNGDGPGGAGDPAADTAAADTAGADTAAALVNLERVGLLDTDQRTAETVQLSSAVKAAVQQAMPTPMRDRAAAEAARALLRAWPEQDADPWLALAFRSCATSLRRAAEVSLWAGGGYPVLFRAGHSLSDAGHTALALGHWRDLAVTSEGVLGSADPSTLTARTELARALVTAGRAEDAISLYEAIADERARTQGPDDPDTLQARASLARALITAGRGGDAMSLFERIVAASGHVAGPEHPDTLTALDGLATACLAAGRFTEATQLMERTLALRERSGWLTRPETMAARVNLADAYCAAGQPKAAIPHYQRVVALRERVLGPLHPDTIAARAALTAAREQLRQRRRGRGGGQ